MEELERTVMSQGMQLKDYLEAAQLTMEQLDGLFRSEGKVLLDLKGILDRAAYEAAGYIYWRL